MSLRGDFTWRREASQVLSEPQERSTSAVACSFNLAVSSGPEQFCVPLLRCLPNRCGKGYGPPTSLCESLGTTQTTGRPSRSLAGCVRVSLLTGQNIHSFPISKISRRIKPLTRKSVHKAECIKYQPIEPLHSDTCVCSMTPTLPRVWQSSSQAIYHSTRARPVPLTSSRGPSHLHPVTVTPQARETVRRTG